MLTQAIHRIRAGIIVPPVEIIYKSHSAWPLHPQGTTNPVIQISVLDSSFNPPTLAHLALMNHPRPVYNNSSYKYSAKLLLLSIRNADKKLKDNDATFEQRIEMMIELANDITNTNSGNNVAVAIIDEPTFVGKSRVLHQFLDHRLHNLAHDTYRTELTFLLGFDTLERFFAPRYYSSQPSDADDCMHEALRGFFAFPPTGDNSHVVCASRASSSYPHPDGVVPLIMPQIEAFFKRENLPSEGVKTIAIGEDVWGISSSAIRQAISADDSAWKTMVSERIAKYIEHSGLYH